ncbi:TonB family protein [Kangiella aquimarina]|uniref:Protein TonB n=1 Tax=Kangiella aquimarina TaxID=261965 RepID=A0ABZ0X3G9_9GAMM|nr:TonB family protein [Kangiella aquimarina]WQG84933.1 TonB family protein [Kangiella aquimarina]
MLSDLKMNGWLDAFWHFNLDLSVIVLSVLIVRFFIRKTTKSYNSYLLWLAIPLGFVVAKIIASIDFSSANSAYIGQAVSVMIAKPVETLQNYWWLGALWLTGTTLLLLRLIIQHIELRKDLRKIEKPISELPGFNLIRKSRYQVIAVDHKDMSPAVYGFIKPTIYFPIHVAKQLSVQQIQLIIEHEEQHIKQKHLWLNLLWDVLVCIGWFNPLIYIARKNFRHDQELFCDYLVLNKGNQTRTKDYGHALLSTVSATHSVSLLCSWKVFNQLEERIMNITDPLNKTGKIVMTLGAAFVLSCCAVYAANKEPKEERVITTENIVIDDEGNKKVVLEFSEGDGITYLQENDNYYILEGDNKRPMTDKERMEFEQKHEEAQKRVYMTEQELMLVEEELENAHRVLVLHEDELQEVEIDIDNAHKALAEAQREIEIDYQKGNISKEEMEQAREAILKAKEEMSSGKMKKRIRVDMERARADMEKARADIEKQRHEIIIRREPADSTSGPHRVFIVDDEAIINGENKQTRVIKWEEDSGKVYSVENGKYMVLENGTKREMTEEEKALFENKVRMIPKPDMPRIPPQPVEPKQPTSALKAKDVTPTSTTPPEYPAYAAKNKIDGYVLFKFDVDGKGKAYNIRVTKSEPEGVFEKAATKAIEQWEFAKDKQVSDVSYKIDFRLE